MTIAIGMLALSAAASHADGQPYKPFDPGIARVESGGSWKDGSQWGTYRAVVRRGCSPEHCYDDLFLEWLGREPLQPTVVSTAHVAEVGGLTHVVDLRFVFSKDRTRLEVRHESDGGEDKWTLCLDLGKPGKYTAKNGRCRSAG
jgi:hypothetical protein